MKNLHQINRFGSTDERGGAASALLAPTPAINESQTQIQIQLDSGLRLTNALSQSSKGGKLSPTTEALNQRFYYQNMKKREENKFTNLKNRVILNNCWKSSTNRPLKSIDRQAQRTAKRFRK